MFTSTAHAIDITERLAAQQGFIETHIFGDASVDIPESHCMVSFLEVC